MWHNQPPLKSNRPKAISIVKVIILLFLSFFVLAGGLGSAGRPWALAASGPAAQTEPGSLPLEDARPPKMAYQPPANAGSLADFVPPGAAQVAIASENKAAQEGDFTIDSLELSATLETAVNPTLDTAVSIQDGLLGVIVEKNTFDQPVTLTFTPTWVSDQREPATLSAADLPQKEGVIIHQEEEKLFRFQIEMAANGRDLTHFDKPVRLVVDLRTFGYDLNETGGKFFLAYQNEANPNEWIEVPVATHQSHGLISAEVTHFSDWTTGWRPEAWAPQWRLPTVSEFSGAAAFQYPFEVPPGRNGLQPALGLSYSSSALNGAVRTVSLGRVATGWSMNEISIVRTGIKLAGTTRYHPDTFRLVLNGTGFELTKEAGASGNVQRFYAKDMPSLRIFSYDSRNYGSGGGYWTVETGDGTHYRLGYQANTRTLQKEQLNEDPTGTEIIAWHVDTVTDRRGNQMTYHYSNGFPTANTQYESFSFWCPWGGVCVNKLWTYDSLLQSIRYNYPDRITAVDTGPVPSTVPQLSTTPASIISFGYDSESYLTTVTVQHGGATIRQYGIAASTDGIVNPGCLQGKPGGSHGTENRTTRTRVINSITHYGFTLNPVTGQPMAVALPTVQLSYTQNVHYYEPGYGNCFIYKYLSGVNNGYGGSTQFTYGHDGRVVGTYDYVAEYEIYYPDIGHNAFVTRLAHNDGRGQTATIDYVYDGRCYNQTAGDIGPKCVGEQTGAPEYGNIGGHSLVSVTINDYDGTPRQRQITSYHTDNKDVFGRTDWQEGGTPHAGNPLWVSPRLSRADSNYTTTVYANGGGSTADDVTFTYTNEEINTQYHVNGSNTYTISNRTTYAYDITRQGGAQYGNLTHTTQYDEANNIYRTSLNIYAPQTSSGLWLVNKPSTTAVYAGDVDPANLLSGSWIYYDGEARPAGGATITKGAVTRQASIIPLACSAWAAETNTTMPPGCAHARKTIDTVFTYDEFGNQTEIVTHQGYGFRAFNSGFGELADIAPSGARPPAVITYDNAPNNGYHLYPVSITNALGHQTQFQIYGFNNVPVAPLAQPGLLKRVLQPDANQATTIYEYDPFGRLVAVFDNPADAGLGDTSLLTGNPASRYHYWDNTWNDPVTQLDPANNKPFPVITYARPQDYPDPINGGPGYELKSATYYDGLGRAIQTQNRWAEVAGQAQRRDIITTTAYDARGQAVCTTTPYDVETYATRGGPSGFVPGACNATGMAYTTYTYDTLGRPLTVTAPDGTAVTYEHFITEHITAGAYSHLRVEKSTDANGHGTAHLYNLFGQLVKAREYQGKWGSQTSYADTEYRYDTLGNLTLVENRKPSDQGSGLLLSTSTMAYDNFGRKISMVDADMGQWFYRYDAAGNLFQQRDGRGLYVCFYYDALNRLVTKSQMTDGLRTACPSEQTKPGIGHADWLASYEYDKYEFSQGQLSEMYWRGYNGAIDGDIYEYDELGRAIRQTRVLNKRPYTMRTLTFDSLHRPLTAAYPDGETVTIAYDHEGPNTLSGTAAGSLVTNLAYNARAQMTSLARGNGANTTYTYYPAVSLDPLMGDGNFRLQSITHSGSGLPAFSYEYDLVGNIAKISENGQADQQFGYDHRNRLTTASVAYVLGYTYDEIGNIKSVANSQGTTTYTYPGLSRPHAVTGLSGAQTGSFQYDNNGNMSQRIMGGETFTQHFDTENRLTKVQKAGGGETLFFYDPSGQRMLTVSDNAQTFTYTPFPDYEEIITVNSGSESVSASAVAEIPTELELTAVTPLWRGTVSVALPAAPRFNVGKPAAAPTAVANKPASETKLPAAPLFAPPLQTPTTVIVDNAQGSGVSIIGTWTTSSYSPHRYGANYLHNGADGNGSKSVQFTPNIAATYVYEVFVMYNAEVSTDRWNAVPIDIYYAGGSTAVTLDQSNVSQSGQWVSLGSYPFYQGQSSSNGSVRIRTTGVPAGKYIIADAVRFVPVYNPYPPVPRANAIVLDNTSSSVTMTGAWTASVYTTGYYHINYLHDGNTGKGSKTVTYTPNIPTTGTYEVYAIWTADSTRASNVPITMQTATGLKSTTVDQRTQGGQWVSLGRQNFEAGTGGYVRISTNGTNGYVIADAVAFAPAPGTPTSAPPPSGSIVVDNSSALEVFIQGDWAVSNYANGYYGSNYLHDRNSGQGSKQVTFQPSLPHHGTYEVYLLWPEGSSEWANNTRVTVQTTAGPQTFNINQEINGNQWRLLGRFPLNAGQGSVTISNTGAEGTVVADAAAFRPAPGVPTSQTLPPGSLILDNAAAGVTLQGAWQISDYADGYYASNYLSDGNSGQGSKRVTFTPTVPTTGRYEVYAIWTSGSDRASNARIDINHAQGTEVRTVDQRSQGGQWVSLGSYLFNAGSGGSVVVRNDGANNTVIADAIGLVPVSTPAYPPQTVVDPTLPPGAEQRTRTTYSLAGQAVAVRQTGLVAKDDFNDGNADGWTAHSGSWSVSGGAYRQTSTTNTATNSSYPLPQSGAMTFEWQATFNSGSRAAGMHILASEAGSTEHGSSYLVWQDATYVRIYETINNIRTQRAIASLAASNGQTYSYKATYDPATGVVTLWRDGVQRLSWTDSSPLSAGAYLALRTSSSSVNFDNVRVTAQSGVVTYLHSDHLGSASALSGANGSLVPGSVARYLPFGDWRTEPTTNPALTDMGFTGHKHNNSGANDLGLIYMNARFYVPGLGRFASADTIVPDPNNPQSFNRYSYVYNNPLMMTDPTGHFVCHAETEEQKTTCEQNVNSWLQILQENGPGTVSYGVAQWFIKLDQEEYGGEYPIYLVQGAVFMQAYSLCGEAAGSTCQNVGIGMSVYYAGLNYDDPFTSSLIDPREDAVLFGHEIVHVYQGHRSKQKLKNDMETTNETEAYYIQYLMSNELGISVDDNLYDIAMQVSNAEGHTFMGPELETLNALLVARSSAYTNANGYFRHYLGDRRTITRTTPNFFKWYQ